MFNYESETSSYQTVGTSFTFGSDVPWDAHVRFQIHKRFVEFEDLPLNVDIVRLNIWQQTRGIKFILIRDHVIQNICQMLVFTKICSRKRVRLARKLVLCKHTFVLWFDFAEIRFEFVILCCRCHACLYRLEGFIYLLFLISY